MTIHCTTVFTSKICDQLNWRGQIMTCIRMKMFWSVKNVSDCQKHFGLSNILDGHHQLSSSTVTINMAFTYTRNKRGNISVICNGYRYNSFRGKWRCSKKDMGCKAVISIDNDEVHGPTHPHCHPSEWGKIKAQEWLCQLKSEARSSCNELPASLIRRHMDTADDEVCANLPKRTALKRAVNRAQGKIHPHSPTSFAVPFYKVRGMRKQTA